MLSEIDETNKTKGMTMYSKTLKQYSSEGFTLIELLIVIVILGILAAIVVFSLGGVVGQSDAAACQSDVNTIQNAINYFATENNGSLPAAQSNLTAASTASNGSTITYLNAWPTATAAANKYGIAWDGTHLDVTVTTPTQTEVRSILYGTGGSVLSWAITPANATLLAKAITPANICSGIQ